MLAKAVPLLWCRKWRCFRPRADQPPAALTIASMRVPPLWAMIRAARIALLPCPPPQLRPRPLARTIASTKAPWFGSTTASARDAPSPSCRKCCCKRHPVGLTPKHPPDAQTTATWLFSNAFIFHDATYGCRGLLVHRRGMLVAHGLLSANSDWLPLDGD